MALEIGVSGSARMAAIALPRMGLEPEPEPGVEDLGMAGDGDGDE